LTSVSRFKKSGMDLTRPSARSARLSTGDRNEDPFWGVDKTRLTAETAATKTEEESRLTAVGSRTSQEKDEMRDSRNPLRSPLALSRLQGSLSAVSAVSLVFSIFPALSLRSLRSLR